MVEFQLNNIYEKGNRLIVEIKIADKIESYGFPLSYKDDDITTGKPQWLHKIKKYLERKYEAGKQEKKTIRGTKKLIKTIYKTEDVEDLSIKGLKKIRRERESKKDDILPDIKLKEEYDKLDAELKLKRKKRAIQREKIKNQEKK